MATTNVSVSFEEDVLVQVREVAARKGMSFSAYIQRLARQAMARENARLYMEWERANRSEDAEAFESHVRAQWLREVA